MSDNERAFYKLAQERGKSLEQAQEAIEDLTAERDGLRTALKGFTDVLGRYGIASSDELNAALSAWKQGIQDGSDVWIIQTQEWGGNPGKLEIVHTKYDRTMADRVGDRVFASAEAASSRMRELMLAACGVRA